MPHTSLSIVAPKLLLTCLGLVGIFVSAAEAGVLYRCVDKQGVTAYTSQREGYRECRLVGNFPASPRAQTAPQSSASTASAPSSVEQKNTSSAVEFRTATGEGEPKAVPVAASVTPRVTRGAVYKFEKNGVTHYTNRRPAGQTAKVLFTYIETCFACSTGSAVDFNSVALNLAAYQDEIADAASRHGVEEALIRAVIHAESAFNPNAISRAGAQGLMQLMPATATRFGVTEAFTPAQNIEGGVSYLAWLSERFAGDIEKVAAGYNAGEGAVDRYGGIPPYQETMVYVERVKILRERYQKELVSSAPATTGVATSGSAVVGGL